MAKSKAKRVAIPGAVKGSKKTPKTVKVATQPRAPKKSNPGAFKKGNQFAFKSRDELGGERDPRIDPGGRRASEDVLLSKSMMIALNNRAPDAVAERLELPKGSSWSQCLAAFILRKAFQEDHWEAAVRLISQMTEGNGRNAALDEIDRMRAQLAAGGGGGKMNIVFVESDQNGGISEQSMADLAAIEEHQRQQSEFSDLALSNKSIEGEMLGYEN